MSERAAIQRLRVDAWTVPTQTPEADGTFAWDSTTLIAARVEAAGCCGLGYTYGHRAVTTVLEDTLAPLVMGRDARDVADLHRLAVAALRNAGYPGIGAMAVSALDVALWDVSARLQDLSLPQLLGATRDRVPVYGSGGFTNYDDSQLRSQLAGWMEAGITRVKIKVGSEPECDPSRVAAARSAIGAAPALMVDANGAYGRGQASEMAQAFALSGVDWFEEPVSSDDLDGLRILRGGAPLDMDITAGEYGWDACYFERMLAAGAVDVLQVDATRCGGYTGFLEAAKRARAHGVPLSAHTAPALHAPLCVAVDGLRHIEYFHDHVRLEQLAFEGLGSLQDGTLLPDRARPGHGLQLRESDLEPYRVH